MATNCWIYAWAGRQWEKRTHDMQFGGKKLAYAASDKFSARGVEAGDMLYVTAVVKGVLYLGGRIEIVRLADRLSASRALGVRESELWHANEYALANPEKLDDFRPRLAVPGSLLDKLWLEHHKSGESLIKRRSNGDVDGQTLRAVRKLIGGEERKLDALLGLSAA